jgi:hypothetical protein
VLKAILFAALAACGVPSTPATAEPPPEQPDKLHPPGEVKPIDQHFCCQSVDPKTESGEGCTAISDSLELINTCGKVLHCEGNWTKDDGKVSCTSG